LDSKGDIIVFCKNCGTENPDDAKFCSNCGADMVVVEPATETSGEKEVKKLTLGGILGWIFGLFFVLVGLASFSSSFIAGISCLVISAVLLPPVNRLFREKMNFELSKGVKIVVIIICLIIFSMTTETDTAPSSTADKTPVATSPPTPTKTISIDEIKEKSIDVSYDELMRHNDKYIGQIVYYKVEITQVQERWGKDKYTLLVRVSGDDPYDFNLDRIWINYEGKRLLEDDLIEVWATVDGLKTYTTVLGARKTVPELTAKHVELIEKAGEQI